MVAGDTPFSNKAIVDSHKLVFERVLRKQPFFRRLRDPEQNELLSLLDGHARQAAINNRYYAQHPTQIISRKPKEKFTGGEARPLFLKSLALLHTCLGRHLANRAREAFFGKLQKAWSAHEKNLDKIYESMSQN